VERVGLAPRLQQRPSPFLRSLENLQADRPDFLADLEDTFMNEKHRVSARFHRRDHLYVHQKLDGLVYRAAPHPGHTRSASPERPDCEPLTPEAG
jgi:hypothetical protein